MTQAEARNAVKRIRVNLEKALRTSAVDLVFDEFTQILTDVQELENQMNVVKMSTPNCRPATREELEQLCKGGNVVMFPVAA